MKSLKRIKKIIAIIASLALVITTVGCGKSDTKTNAGNNTAKTEESIKTVRIGIPAADASSFIENAGFAEKLGYIEKELEKVGYKAEFTGFGQGGPAITEAIVSGKIDVAFEGDIPPVIANDNGTNLKVFASLNHSAGTGIVVGNNSGINSVADLKGKKIVAGFGTVTYVSVLKVLEKNGLSINDVEIINDIANGATLVSTGDADAVASSGVGIYQFQGAGIGKILKGSTSYDDDSFSNQYFAVSTSDYLDKNEEAAKAIIKSLIDAKQAVADDPEGVFKKIADKAYPAEIYASVYPNVDNYEYLSPYLTDNLKDKYNELASILKESKVIKQDGNADDVFVNKYNEEVYKELGLDIPKK